MSSSFEAVCSGLAEVKTLKKMDAEKTLFSDLLQVVQRQEGPQNKTLKVIETRMREVKAAQKQIEEMTNFVNLTQFVENGKKYIFT